MVKREPKNYEVKKIYVMSLEEFKEIFEEFPDATVYEALEIHAKRVRSKQEN